MSSHSYKKDMGYSFQEFFRMLPVALSSSDYEIRDRIIDFDAGQGRHIKITLGEETKRQIALLAIPIMPVSIELFGYSDTQAEEFMAIFDRAYHRGGG